MVLTHLVPPPPANSVVFHPENNRIIWTSSSPGQVENSSRLAPPNWRLTGNGKEPNLSTVNEKSSTFNYVPKPRVNVPKWLGPWGLPKQSHCARCLQYYALPHPRCLSDSVRPVFIQPDACPLSQPCERSEQLPRRPASAPRALSSPQAAKQSICRGSFSRIGTGSKASCMAASSHRSSLNRNGPGRAVPGPRTSPAKRPTVMLDRDPSYRPYDNTAINTGLPPGLSPPLPQQKPRPFRPASNTPSRNSLALGFLPSPGIQSLVVIGQASDGV